jgi:prephenate dehydrogenase
MEKSHSARKRTAFIIGLGLIGGSIARAIRMAHENAAIIGYDVRSGARQRALSLGVIDRCADSVESGAREADFIVLAAPVGAVIETIERLAAVELKKDVLITDTGSAKRLITARARAVLGDRYVFIGGHPMAGSHKSGVAASRADLFENAFYFLTPDRHAGPEDIERLKEWLKGTRARFLTIDAEIHDRIVGVLSHFPHLIAAALVHELKDFPDHGLNISRFAAGGFRDITRIASSDPSLWQDIVYHNRDVLIDCFSSWGERMERIQELLREGDVEGIKRFFLEAKMFRDQFPVKQKGTIPSANDLYLDIPDRPGEIARVTAAIAEGNVSLTNIQVIEWREDVWGVLRLSFPSAEARDRADALLKKKGYATYVND